MKKISFFLLSSFLFSYLSWAYNPAKESFPHIPDREITPGMLCTFEDRDFSEVRYAEGIPYCKRNVQTNLKKIIYKIYGVPSECQKFYTIDHFYPLSLGGNNNAKNLWPEHKDVKKNRQALENRLYVDIKFGRMKQHEALERIEWEKMNPMIDHPLDICTPSRASTPLQLQALDNITFLDPELPIHH